MSRLALALFDRLMDLVDQIEPVAAEVEASGRVETAATLRRSAWVLGVAALDTFMHELGVELLHAHCARGREQPVTVANYAKSVSAEVLEGADAESHLRLRLSYKTLVAPRSIDALIVACGYEPDAVWMSVALKLQTRPDRLRMLTDFIFDRRNQIAHEGDWDISSYDLRPMDSANLRDCLKHLVVLARGLAEHFAQ